MSTDVSCIFCRLNADRLLSENSLAMAFLDAFPVTVGHSLVIPKRHVTDVFGLTTDEIVACHVLLAEIRKTQMKSDLSIDGYNVGVNAGEAAGQTVFHCHFHLIPRRTGDVPDPRGGVRHVIPGKGNYQIVGETQ